VHGTADGIGSLGMWADATGGAIGIQATSDTGNCLHVTSDSGIAFYAASLSSGVAVLQSGGTGTAVIITSGGDGLVVGASGDGVHASTGTAGAAALFGEGGAGVGVRAKSTTDNALQVEGPAAFSRSGVVIVKAGNRSAKVTGVPLTGKSLILATVQAKGSTYVKQAVPNPVSDSFIVYVNEAPVDTPVAWFVVN
jgi:hypothetical protein